MYGVEQIYNTLYGNFEFRRIVVTNEIKELSLAWSVQAISTIQEKNGKTENRRNGLKSLPQSKKDTNNTSGKSQFLYFIIYSDKAVKF